MDFNNRIDHHLRAVEAKKEAEALKDKIAEISECAVSLHDAYFGNEFDRDALLRSEEYLIEFMQYLRGRN
jgi:predicted secreted Zn-dependent protease